MLVYDANEWNAAKGEVRVELDQRHQVEVSVSCTQDVQLLGLREKEKIPLKIGREYRVKAQTKGFSALILKADPSVTFGFRVRQLVRQDGEPLNNDNPPAPPMPGANNLIAQMQRMMRDEFNRNRPPVMDPENLPWADRYAVDDDDFDFEEEIHASQQASSKPSNGDGAKQTPTPSVPEGQQVEEKTPPPAEAAE